MRPAPANSYFKGKYYCSLHRYPSCGICGKQQTHARFQVGWTCSCCGILWELQ
jgi:ribosomal protein L37AE/L43A